MVKIKLKKDANLKGTTMIEGFSGGTGLVGTIAANYIIEKEKMDPVGHIESNRFPPVTHIHEGRPQHPIRIYKHPDKNICILIGELIIPSEITQELSNKILNFAEEQEIEKIISIGGMRKTTGEKNSEKVYGITSKKELKKELEELDVELIKEGIAMGVSGVILAKAAEKQYPAISLLAESRRNLPDPEAAAEIVKKINKIFETDIDTDELKEKAKDIEQKTKKLVKRVKKAQKRYKESEEKPISPMYG
ncbi:MAG: proteasome assembly chaperone family protein [archaeon]